MRVRVRVRVRARVSVRIRLRALPRARAVRVGNTLGCAAVHVTSVSLGPSYSGGSGGRQRTAWCTRQPYKGVPSVGVPARECRGRH